MKQVFVINNCGKLNDIADCSKRIKEHLDANSVPYENITVMVTHAPKFLSAQETLKNIFGMPKALFYGEGQAFIVYHDIHHIESKTIVLLLDENTTTEVVKALMHNPGCMGKQQCSEDTGEAKLAPNPAYEFNAKNIRLFTLRSPGDCIYIGEL